MTLPRMAVSGRLVADPELRFTQKGIAVATFTVVAADRRKNEDGKWEDGNTLFLSCEVWRQPAENFIETATKGDLVLVAGRLMTQAWTDEDGGKHSRIVLVAEDLGPSVQFRQIPHGAGRTTRSDAAPAGEWEVKAEEEPPF